MLQLTSSPGGCGQHERGNWAEDASTNKSCETSSTPKSVVETRWGEYRRSAMVRQSVTRWMAPRNWGRNAEARGLCFTYNPSGDKGQFRSLQHALQPHDLFFNVIVGFILDVAGRLCKEQTYPTCCGFVEIRSSRRNKCGNSSVI